MEGLLDPTLANEGQAGGYGAPRYSYEVVDSTLDVARNLALDGAPDGSLVVAQHQLAGRGRRRARWVDAPGESALLTYVLRPSSQTVLSEPWRIPFIGSLACVLAARRIGLRDAQVKWPNDICSRRRKLGGMIVETVDRGANTACYLLGIGMNVLQSGFIDAEQFVQPATSFAIELADIGCAHVPSVADVIEAVSRQLGDAMLRYADDPAGLMLAWRSVQMTGQMQRGISLDGTRDVCGEYLDVRPSDGAGLIRTDANGSPVAVLPGR